MLTGSKSRGSFVGSVLLVKAILRVEVGDAPASRFLATVLSLHSLTGLGQFRGQGLGDRRSADLVLNARLVIGLVFAMGKLGSPQGRALSIVDCGAVGVAGAAIGDSRWGAQPILKLGRGIAFAPGVESPGRPQADGLPASEV